MLNDDVDVRMSDGRPRLFHARGPATANARSPMVERRVLYCVESCVHVICIEVVISILY